MRYKLGEICEIVSGSTPKTNIDDYWDGEIKWITPAELNDNSYIITDSVRKITEKAVKETGLSALPRGTVILSSRAPIGKVAIAGCEMYCNQGFKNLICSDVILNRYLFWFLKGKTEYLNSLGRGATFKEISKQIVASIEIDVPSKSAQEAIIAYFETLQRIIQLYQQQLSKLDDLVKSRFVEMFGNLSTTRYEIQTLGELCQFIKDGTHQTPVYSDDTQNGYKFLSSKDVTSKRICWNDVKYIPKVLHDELYARVSPQRGDLLIAKNGTTGIAAVVDTDEIFDIYVSLALLRLKPGHNVYYIWAAVNSSEVKAQFDASLKGIGVPNLHLGEIKKARIITPPIETQNQFAAFAAQVDKSKSAVQSALDKAQLLFDSLMQKYFG